MKRYFTYHHSFSTCYEKEPICGVNTQPFFTYANKMKIMLEIPSFAKTFTHKTSK